MTIGTFLVNASILMFIDDYKSQNSMQMHPSLFISPTQDPLLHTVISLDLNLSVEAFITRNIIHCCHVPKMPICSGVPVLETCGPNRKSA